MQMKSAIIPVMRLAMALLVYAVPVLGVVISAGTGMPIWLGMFFAFLPLFAVWCTLAIIAGHGPARKTSAKHSEDD